MDGDDSERRASERRRQSGEKRQSVVLEMVQTIDEKHDDAHHRLRQDYRSLERRLTALETAKVATELHLARIDATPPPDVTKLQWTTRTVMGVVVFCVGLAAGQITLNARLEANVKAMIDQNARVQDERYAAMQKTINELKNRFELSQIEQNTFNKDLLRDRRR